MKKYLSGVITGVLVSTLILGTALSALAISGRMTIEVDPINIQVNGQTFAPKDVNGKEVPVFAYQGTTYAPLRALAEAYGLEVGYDAGANMASVNDPDVKPEQPATPDTTAKDELVVYDEDGKIMTGCEFDTCDVYINNVKLTSDTPITILSYGMTFISFEQLARAFDLDIKFDVDLCKETYVYVNDNYYVRPLDVITQMPTISIDYDIESGTYKFY